MSRKRTVSVSAKDMLSRKLEEIAATTEDEDKRALFKQEMNGFQQIFQTAYLSGRKGVDWAKISPPPEGMVLDHSTLQNCPAELRTDLLNKLVVLKLNGGLGTTMGCKGPKSLIEIHSGHTFLDLTVQQIQNINDVYNVDVPLVLMNSFNTDKETEKSLHKYSSNNVTIHRFNQRRYPRIEKDTLLPLPEDIEGDLADWYPPGHGDVFEALFYSPVFQSLRESGREYIFISNIDNLGATVDFNILYQMHVAGNEFVMEVTDKTRSDIKGGTLIEYEGKAKLLEIAQVPSAKLDEFKSVKKFKIFNTNNLWANLSAVERLVNENAFVNMDVIFNSKVAEKDGSKVSVIQLERAAGAAIEFFQKGIGINVPRSRFLPVKDTADLFVVQSDMYSLHDGTLAMNPLRPFPTVPLVKFGEEFKAVHDYMRRFQNIPNILELYHLTVSGDVCFGSNVTLSGTVIIVANHDEHIDIPSGSFLENKVISGSLRILDH